MTLLRLVSNLSVVMLLPSVNCIINYKIKYIYRTGQLSNANVYEL